MWRTCWYCLKKLSIASWVTSARFWSRGELQWVDSCFSCQAKKRVVKLWSTLSCFGSMVSQMISLAFSVSILGSMLRPISARPRRNFTSTSSMAGGRSCLELLNCWIDRYPGFVARERVTWLTPIWLAIVRRLFCFDFSSNMFSFHAAMAASRHSCCAAPFRA